MVENKNSNVLFKISFVHKLCHKELLYWLRIWVEKYFICVFSSVSLNISGQVTGKLFLGSISLRS